MINSRTSRTQDSHSNEQLCPNCHAEGDIIHDYLEDVRICQQCGHVVDEERFHSEIEIQKIGEVFTRSSTFVSSNFDGLEKIRVRNQSTLSFFFSFDI